MADVETTSCCHTGRGTVVGVGGNEVCEQADLAVDIQGCLGEEHATCHAGSQRDNDNHGHSTALHHRWCEQPCHSLANGRESFSRLLGVCPVVPFRVVCESMFISSNSSVNNVIKVCARLLEGRGTVWSSGLLQGSSGHAQLEPRIGRVMNRWRLHLAHF